MLIPSDRHTRADLELWAELERADKAHANSRMLWRNYRRCEEFVREFLNAGPAYCSVSWGKDSVVIAHLVLSIRPATPLCWIRVEPIKSPDCELVRDAFLRLHPKTDYSEVEIWCDRSDGEWHATGTLEAGITQAQKQLGNRVILGLRGDESSTRQLRMWAHGINTERTSAPLAYLTANDIFAVLQSRSLPVHPAYAMLGGGRWQRHHLRVASLGGKRGDGHGRAAWEQEYYGDVLRRLEAGR